MSRLSTASLAALCLSAAGCEARQDDFLYALVDACSDADSSAPWIETVDYPERVYDEDGAGHQVMQGTVTGAAVREQNPYADWTGTVVLDLATVYEDPGSQTTGTLELRGLVPEDGPAAVDGTVDYRQRYQSEGAGVEVVDSETFAFIPPDWSYRVTHISGDLDFEGRWDGRHTVDLTVTVESYDGEEDVWLVGSIDGRDVDSGG